HLDPVAELGHRLAGGARFAQLEIQGAEGFAGGIGPAVDADEDVLVARAEIAARLVEGLLHGGAGGRGFLDEPVRGRLLFRRVAVVELLEEIGDGLLGQGEDERYDNSLRRTSSAFL